MNLLSPNSSHMQPANWVPQVLRIRSALDVPKGARNRLEIHHLMRRAQHRDWHPRAVLLDADFKDDFGSGSYHLPTKNDEICTGSHQCLKGLVDWEVQLSCTCMVRLSYGITTFDMCEGHHVVSWSGMS